MAQPDWNKTLGEVLKKKAEKMEKVSERTGNSYTTDVIPLHRVRSTGNREVADKEGGKKSYKYAVVDREYEYTIKAPNEVEVSFGTVLEFINVTGGPTNHGGWYSADSVSVVQKNG